MSNLEATDNGRAEAEECRRLLQRDPDSLRFAELADHLRRAGLTSDATAVCARGLMRHPGYATGHVVMGEIFRDAGMMDKAEREWLEALSLDPGHPRAHLRLGELYQSQGESNRAVAAFEAALLSNPQFAEARSRLAEMRGDFPQERADPGEAPTDEGRWHPGERPVWLTSSRFEDLVAAVRGCPPVETAALVDSDGLLLAGEMPAPRDPEAAAKTVVQAVARARDLLARLGAGRLRSALIRGKKGSFRCLSLGDLTLITELKPKTSVEPAETEIEEAIAGAREQGEVEAEGDE